MKKNLFSTIILLSISFSNAQINFKDSFAESQKNAKGSKKLLFVDFTATWCGPCKMMDKKVFSKPEVSEYINKNFIPVRLDIDQPEGKKISEQYSVDNIPTMIIFDYNGKVIKRIEGYHPEKELLKILNSIKQ